MIRPEHTGFVTSRELSVSTTASTHSSAIVCPHERGPGTALCLRCRAEANSVSAGRQRRALAKVGVGFASLLAVLAFGGRLMASRGDGLPAPASPREQVAVAQNELSPGVVQQAQAATPPAAPASSDSLGISAALVPVVPSGRTDLHDGVYAERSAGEVTVHFDTPGTRTRRREKFEQLVRRTLPALYGPDAAALLAAIPHGRLLPEGNLVSELPSRGIKLPTSDGGSVTLWPATRPGQDGPLVVSYRVAVSPSE